MSKITSDVENPTPLDLLRTQLTDLGWVIYPDNDRFNSVSWYACSQPGLGRHCENNEKPPQFVLRPYQFGQDIPPSVEMSVCGEVDGVWYDLKSYGMGPVEVLERMATVSASLLAAWEALA
jgi:hypothetical protein